MAAPRCRCGRAPLSSPHRAAPGTADVRRARIGAVGRIDVRLLALEASAASRRKIERARTATPVLRRCPPSLLLRSRATVRSSGRRGAPRQGSAESVVWDCAPAPRAASRLQRHTMIARNHAVPWHCASAGRVQGRVRPTAARSRSRRRRTGPRYHCPGSSARARAARAVDTPTRPTVTRAARSRNPRMGKCSAAPAYDPSGCALLSACSPRASEGRFLATARSADADFRARLSAHAIHEV